MCIVLGNIYTPYFTVCVCNGHITWYVFISHIYLVNDFKFTIHIKLIRFFGESVCFANFLNDSNRETLLYFSNLLIEQIRLESNLSLVHSYTLFSVLLHASWCSMFNKRKCSWKLARIPKLIGRSLRFNWSKRRSVFVNRKPLMGCCFLWKWFFCNTPWRWHTICQLHMFIMWYEAWICEFFFSHITWGSFFFLLSAAIFSDYQIPDSLEQFQIEYDSLEHKLFMRALLLLVLIRLNTYIWPIKWYENHTNSVSSMEFSHSAALLLCTWCNVNYIVALSKLQPYAKSPVTNRARIQINIGTGHWPCGRSSFIIENFEFQSIL